MSGATLRVVLDVATFTGRRMAEVVRACYTVLTALVIGACVAGIVSLITYGGRVFTWISSLQAEGPNSKWADPTPLGTVAEAPVVTLGISRAFEAAAAQEAKGKTRKPCLLIACPHSWCQG